MSWSEEPSSWESTHDILEYLGFAGVETTRDQLARLHRRRLIGEPFHEVGGARSSLAQYPSGTAERCLRISQLRSTTKQLDELAWRLWWEGYDLEPDLIRTYVLKRATRWDEQLREIRATTDEGIAVDKGERDVLEEVFFEHLKVAPAMVSARKRLGRGSELFAEFTALLIDLLRGDGANRRTDASLFNRQAEDVRSSFDDRDVRGAGELALVAMQRSVERPFIELVALLDDKAIANARPMALWLLDHIADVGGIVQEVFGGAGHGRDNVGKSLMTMAENSEEQVLALLLTSSFLQEDRVKAALPDVAASPPASPPISFVDFLRLRYLAVEVPGLATLLSPTRIREAFASLEGLERWRSHVDDFMIAHLLESHEAMALRPDLFLEPSPESDEDTEIEVEVKKKNLK